LPSRERFRRALERVGCDDTRLAEAAVHLSRAHMALIATATILPDEHRALLEALRPRYRLGLVSNFDDTATAYEILRRHGLLAYLDSVVVSETLGRGKPHPALVRAGLVDLGLGPDGVRFVGDAVARGAAAAGGSVVGVIPGADPARATRHLSIVIPTGMGHARNVLVAAAGDALIALPGEHGTLAEIALACAIGRPVVVLGGWR